MKDYSSYNLHNVFAEHQELVSAVKCIKYELIVVRNIVLAAEPRGAGTQTVRKDCSPCLEEAEKAS